MFVSSGGATCFIFLCMLWFFCGRELPGGASGASDKAVVVVVLLVLFFLFMLWFFCGRELPGGAGGASDKAVVVVVLLVLFFLFVLWFFCGRELPGGASGASDKAVGVVVLCLFLVGCVSCSVQMYLEPVWFSSSSSFSKNNSLFSVFCLFLVGCVSCSVQMYLEPVWFSSSSSFSKNSSVLYSLRSKSFPVVLSRERLCAFCIIVFCWSLGSLPVFCRWCVHIRPRPRFLAGFDYLRSFFDFFLLVLLGGIGPIPLCLEGPAGVAAVSPPTTVDCDYFVVPMQQEEVTVNFMEACVAPVDEVMVEVEQSVVAQIPSVIFYFFADHYYTKATGRIAPDCNAVIVFLLCLVRQFLLFVLFVLEFSMCLSKLAVLQFVGDFGPGAVLWPHRTGEALPLTVRRVYSPLKLELEDVFSLPGPSVSTMGGEMLWSPSLSRH